VALTATLGFEGATEIELSDFGVVEVVVIADPQPVIDIKTKGRTTEISLIRQRKAFMLASRRFFEDPYRAVKFPS
jgi:hypothetical protein